MSISTVLLLECAIGYLLLRAVYPELASLNQNPPAYIKQVVAYSDGTGGLMLYIVLADADGRMTTSSGMVEVELLARPAQPQAQEGAMTRLPSVKLNVQQSDFYTAKVGHGAFEHEAVLCPLGRIPYNKLSRNPAGSAGTVKVTFKPPNGQMLEGEEQVFF